MSFTEKYAYGRWWTWDEWQTAVHHHAQNRKGPYIITDTADPFRSMADGQMYDSKSQYRADLKARGLEEVGNDPGSRTPPPRPEFDPVEPDLKAAWDQLSAE